MGVRKLVNTHTKLVQTLTAQNVNIKAHNLVVAYNLRRQLQVEADSLAATRAEITVNGIFALIITVGILMLFNR